MEHSAHPPHTFTYPAKYAESAPPWQGTCFAGRRGYEWERNLSRPCADQRFIQTVALLMVKLYSSRGASSLRFYWPDSAL